MIQPHGWSAVKQEGNRSLRLPPLNTFFHEKKGVSRSRLQELDVAASLQQLKISSPRCPPSPLSDWLLVEPALDNQPCILPSFRDGFSDVIAAADRESVHSSQSSTTGRGSPVSEYSWTAASPLSTAHSSPATSPITPCYNISPQSQVDIRVHYTPYREEDSERKKRHLALNRLRRVSSQSALRAGYETYGSRLATSSKQLRRPVSTASLKTCGKKERHFNQKYQNPDKLFIVYCKDDLKKGWAEIQALRLRMLPLLLGNDYDRSVEEHREIAGLNGMYYRENDLNMSVLTPDGSGLEFVEKDGRWWECIRSQKCRTGEGRAAKKGSSSDVKPRGMVERYPEEVLEYWDKHVQHFIPKEKHAEVLGRAIKYCRIRAEQRKHYNVPKWSLDNKDDRVIDITPKKTGDESSSTAQGKPPRRARMI